MEEPIKIDIESVKQWSDDQIIEYLKKYWEVQEFVFECFMSDIPLFTTNKEKYIGSLTKFRTITGRNQITYPDIISNRYIHFNIKRDSNIKIKKGWHKITLKLADRDLRLQANNMFMMYPIYWSMDKLNKEKDNFLAPKKVLRHSPLKEKESSENTNPTLLNDSRIKVLQSKWGKSIFKLVGVYTYKDGVYSLDCVRKVNFSRLEDKPISIKLEKQLKAFNIGDCIEFTWKFKDANGIEITIDKPIKTVVPQEIITRLYKDAISNEGRSTDLALHGIENNRINISGQDRNTFIYELLQNANDYPQKDQNGNKIPVHVEFEFEGDYLYFRHTGAKFSVQNVLGICGIGEKEKIDNIETIGYKGVGFKNVFIDCDYVYIKTGDYSFRFDKDKIARSAVSFETTPIWTLETPKPLRTSFEKNKDYNVQIALKPRDNSLINMAEVGYIDRFLEAFNDPRIIIFIPWIDSVTLKVPGHDDITCTRNGKEGNWLVSNPEELKTNISPEIKSKIIELIDSRQGRMPEKFKKKTDTSVSFACQVEGKVLKPVEDSRIYCYLPTKDSWGFKFLMNTDMIPTGPRDGIEQQEYWNIEYSEIAGRAFFKWIKQLLEAEYDYDSVFALIPNFEECKIGRNKDHVNMISRFQKGFEECIKTQKLIPTLSHDKTIEFVCIKNIVLDLTCITGHGVFEDRTFLTYSKLIGKLAHPSLRLSPNFNRVLSQYGDKSLRFDKSSLWGFFQNVFFKIWLKNKDNNTRWTNFVIVKYPEEYSKLPMFISEHDSTKLYLAADLYYNIDDILVYLSAFKSILPRLSTFTRENCKILEGEKHQGKFKERKLSELIDGILFNETNIIFTQQKLRNKENSVCFIKFLAEKKYSADKLFNKIPLNDIEGKQIPAESTSERLRKLFFNSDFVSQMRKEQWFSNSWVRVLDEAYYSDADVKEYLKGYNVSELEDHYVINNLLVDGKCCEDVTVNVGNSQEISKRFVEYLYTHQDSIDGIEVKTSETEKTTKYDRFTGYSLFFANGKGEIKSLPVSMDVAFNDIKDDYLNYGWFDNSWIYQVADTYYDSKDEKEKSDLAAFLKKYFGLVDMNDSRFKSIVKDHFDEIKPKITESRESNLSFWAFLGKYQWNENSKDINIFKVTPLMLDGESLPTNISGKKNLYYYNEELHEIANSSWMPGDLITILSNEYDTIPGIKELLDIIGFGTYDVRFFSPFFDNVIVKQEIPTTIPEQVTPTQYSVALDTKEKCVDFHNFMSKKYSLLNDFEKSLLRGMPVYVYGKENPRRLAFGWRSYILGEDKFGIQKQCVAGLLPEIYALDSSFVNEGNLTYWKEVLGCITMDEEALCLWIEQNSTSISQTLQLTNQNISFWTWLFDLGINSQSKIGRLKNLPIISFAVRDANGKEENQKIASISTAEAYMSNLYMGQAQIEDFARNHGKTNFVSSIYIREGDNTDDWRRFFRNLGVKDDVKDVIYSIIMNDLPSLQDKRFPWVLVDQYSKELADAEIFKELTPKLAQLQVETTTAGVFVPIVNAQRITVDDYSTKEPFKMVKLDGEISRDYYEDENVKNLIIKIADAAQSQKITELQLWLNAKVAQYIIIQNGTLNEEFKNIHFAFVKELLIHPEYTVTRRGEIKLYDRDEKLTSADNLYLGSNYECKCNFEKFGITKHYVHDDYLKLGKTKECSSLLRSFGCQDRFKDNDIDIYYLIEKDFSIYFWCKYVASNDVSIISTINKMVKEGKFNFVACIPSVSGKMKKASELYSSSLADYMRCIPDYQDKIIDQKMQFTEPLIELCKQCMDRLSIGDIINFLVKSKPKNVNRISALQWLLDDNSENKEKWLATYISNNNALWLNGQGKPSHVSSLLAIDPNKCNQAYVFKSSPRVIDISYFPQGRELDVCKMFKIQVFSDDDLVPKPVTTPDSGQTLTVSREIIRRLLLVIAYRYKFNWSDMFSQMKQKMQDLKFMLCESISYGYNDLSIDNEDFYFDQNNKTFYYVDSWQDKKVYESFISKLCGYLSMDLDYRECKGKLDENFNGKKVANYLNLNCKDLYNDEEFVSVIKQYWNDIVPLLDIKVEEEQEEDGDEVVEEVTQEKYYEKKLKEDQKEEQVERSGSETQEESGVENTQTETTRTGSQSTETTRTGSQSTDSTKTTSSHDATSSEQTEQSPDSAPDNDVSQDSVEEKKNTTDSKESKDSKQSESKQSESKQSENKQSENTKGNSSDSGSSRQSSSSSSQRQRSSYYEPKTPTAEEIKRFKYQSSTKTFSTEDMQANEYEALKKILGEGLSPEDIVTENFLARLRFWNSLNENDMTPTDVSLEDFVRNKDKDEYELTNGKYVHRCSARGGILHISPSIWNKVTDDRCIICVFVGAKVNEFFYIHNKKELLDWIAEDAIVIKLTGSEKVEAVNRLYSEILMDTQGTAYTLIRVAYNESYNSIFSDMESQDFYQTKINDDAYGE